MDRKKHEAQDSEHAPLTGDGSFKRSTIRFLRWLRLNYAAPNDGYNLVVKTGCKLGFTPREKGQSGHKQTPAGYETLAALFFRRN